MVESIENEYVKLWIEEEILFSYYKKGCFVGIKEAREIVELRLKFSKGKIFETLTYVDLIGKITPEARGYFAREGYEGISKLAIILSTPTKAMLGNIFIKLDKPVKPTKLFSNVDEAKKWLKKN